MKGKGWNYKTSREYYLLRDRSHIALLYLLACRISESLRINKDHFIDPFKAGQNRILLRGIKLSKSRVKGKPRRDQYRQEAWLPLTGSRSRFTHLILSYLRICKTHNLYISDRSQARKYINALTSQWTPHYFRAFGEDFLYTEWDKDIMAVSDYVKVDPRTLQHYLRKGYQKYKSV